MKYLLDTDHISILQDYRAATTSIQLVVVQFQTGQFAEQTPLKY